MRTGFPLTRRTKMAAATADHNPLDRRATDPAGLSRAIINAVQALKIAGVSLGIAIVAQRAAAMTQRPAKRRLDGAIERAHLF